MKLELEIKQKAFKSEFHKLAVNLLFSHGWLMSSHKELLQNQEITITQYNILRILRGQYPSPVSINLLKERMLDKMSDTSRLIERLRIKGLVDRKVCKDDRRKSDVKITDSGLDTLKKLDYIDSGYEKLFEELNQVEVNLLNDLLDKMRG